MNTTVTSERTYSISYYRPGTKLHYGVSITVSGDKKAKVIHEAKELLIQAEADTMQVSKNLEPVIKEDAEVQSGQ
jgi:hypothetical protein